MALWITLLTLNSTCLIVNIIRENYWVIPLNVIAIAACAMNIKE